MGNLQERSLCHCSDLWTQEYGSENRPEEKSGEEYVHISIAKGPRQGRDQGQAKVLTDRRPGY